jgi:hypothetical protein
MNANALQKAGAASALVLLVAALGACGGGGGGSGDSGNGPGDTPPPAALAQGLFTGTLTGSASTQFQMLALENGDIWALYGVPSGASFVVRGFVQGSTTRIGTSVSSASIRDFGSDPAPTGTLSGTITTDAVNGLINFSGSQVSFSGSRPASTTYEYDVPANLALVTGNWTLAALDGTTATVTIAPNGSFTGNNAGCLFSGTATPRASGKNVFDIVATSDGAPCREPGSTATGIAVTYLLPNSTTRELVVAVVNGARTSGNAFFGVR